MKSTALSTPSIPPPPPPPQAEIAAQHQQELNALVQLLRGADLKIQQLCAANDSLENALADEQRRAEALADELHEMQQQRKAEQVEIVGQLRSALITRRDMLSDLQEFETRHADALRAGYALVLKIEATLIPPDEAA